MFHCFIWVTELWSQWSLTLEVRKSPQLPGFRLPQGIASQWSLTFEVRKRFTVLRNHCSLMRSQWSLTFEVRKSGRDRVLVAEGVVCRNGA